ncbi:50S ribosomal protein L10 [Propionibacteriaceae bacterium Y2011]|uniref:50S ribosomal protein L10 n=1 Tax=Microlunatus sp. Y2014 TaxID=3418488 RepID=UPI003B4F79F0
MASPDRVAVVAELKDKFTNSSGAVLTEYRGLTVTELQTLRRALGEDATYAVSKNTLTKIAAKEAGVEGLDDLLTGPTAIAFVDGDPVNVAKGLRDFAKDNPLLVIKGGVLDGKVLTTDEVKKLADLESREVLLAKLAGGMKAAPQRAVSLLAAPLSKVARGLGALQTAAAENPALIGGPGAAAQDQKSEDNTENEPAAPAAENDAAPAAEEK